MDSGYKHARYIVILLVPLALSAYTHLWNPLGFPSIHIDESHYMRRAMLVIQGMGPQESAASGYPRTYDHPYFGQLFLGGVLSLIGYPNILKPISDAQSIEMLHMIPRLLMGLLAILDTFLLFKITERRYGITVALIASVLFAVMPMTWILRRVYLDTILIPFLLSSILFAVWIKRPIEDLRKSAPKSKYMVSDSSLALVSGIFLGLAIYTKAPAFTMMPLVGSLIFLNSRKRLRSLGIWFIPVILIPLLWPLYSVVAGQSDLWVEWVLWQTDRNKPLSISLANFIQIDPVITLMGIAGFIWTGIRKDFFPLMWVAPFLIFSYFIGWVQYFHLIIIFPAFCIASAVLLNRVQIFIRKHSNQILSQTPFVAIAGFGLIISTMLMTTNVNTSYYEIYGQIARNLPDPNSKNNENVTLIGSHWWVWDSYWITQSVLGKHHELIDPHFDPKFKQPVNTKNVVFIDDEKFLDILSHKVKSNNFDRIRELNNQSSIKATFFDNVTANDNGVYPNNIFSIMILNENHPTGKVIIKRNY